MPRKNPGPPCRICGEPSVAKNLCAKHYKRAQRSGGDPEKTKNYNRLPKEVLAQNARERAYKRKYGISMDDYSRMSKAQSHQCKVCGVKDAKLLIDHCHDTGEVRGLLCHNCNVSLGLMKDDPGILRAAAKYLEDAAKK